MSAFQVGNTYTTRSICDHNCIISVTIAKRTEKTVTDSNGKNFGLRCLMALKQLLRGDDTAWPQRFGQQTN